MFRPTLTLVTVLAAAPAAAATQVHWSLFNIEGESTLSAEFVTYATLGDMLADSNRLGVFTPDGGGAGRNIVGSGAYVAAAPAAVPLPGSAALVIGAVGALIAVKRRSG